MSIQTTNLTDEARSRYINYALSVVTSRALPDVRDGLKPVQRRILYTMRKDLGLTPDAKYRKCAKIVGDVMGNYHPHGDLSIYDAMVRMAQPWVMRAQLVDGQGNFGSADGDGAAAYRYTEAKLLPLAMELLDELDRRTVGWRPNYDGTRSEPLVLPARYPNLLVNGAQGIAVGMATSIPTHNLGEVIDASVAQIDAGTRDLTTRELMKFVKGPDFPTGASLLATRDELHNIYETGSGSLKLKGDYKLEEKKNGATDIIITSMPYAVERSSIVEKIAEIIINKKLPAMVDVRDESTAEVRVVVEVKKGADPQLVMAYLYKHTPLQTSVTINMTCLVPGAPLAAAPQAALDGKVNGHAKAAVIVADGEDDAAPMMPERLSLGKMLRHFLQFRMETVRRRITFDLGQLRARIHLLDGVVTVFDALDETIKIIRKSENKADAKEKLIRRFELSEEQTEYILEMKLYKLASLELLMVQKELDQKRAEAKRLEVLLKSDARRWELIKGELLEIKQKYSEKRKTKIVGSTDEPEYAAEDFIMAEDANVVLTSQGWIKRVRELKDLTTTRVREGDAVLSVLAGSTKASVAFFSSFGACYVTRIHDVPATTGYGDPIQKYFKLADGERIIACLSFDPRVLAVPEPAEGGEPQPPYAMAVTRGGLALRFSLTPHREPSTKSGRKFAKLNEGDEVVLLSEVKGREGVLVATSDGYALGVRADEVPVLSGVGKGSALIKLAEGERVVGAQIAASKHDAFTVETEKGKSLDLAWDKIAGSRGEAGESIVKRDRFARVVPPPPVLPSATSN
jgi:DNA gyrase subunit A